MKSLVYSVGPENFEREVISEKRPVLLLCMPRNEDFPKARKMLEEIAKRTALEMKVCLLREDYIATFKEQYRVVGTPTFLILDAGKERKRLLGLADEKALADFVERS